MQKFVTFITVCFAMIAFSSLTQAEILVFSADGNFIRKSSLSSAATASDVSGKKVYVTGREVVTTAIVWPDDRELIFKEGGYITFKGAGSLTGLKEARPEWFGVNTTEGVTDMTSAVQSAINSAGAGTVILSNIYKITAQLYVINSYTKIVSGGKGGTLRHGTSLAHYAPLVGISTPASIVVYKASHVKIEGIHIDQTGLRTAACDGIQYFKGSTYGVVKNCRITNSQGDAIHFYDSCNNALITDNTITGSTLDGILFHARSHQATISNNIIRNTAIVPIEVEGRIGSGDTNLQPCSDITITGNTIVNDSLSGNQGIMIGWSSNVVITGNSLKKVQGVVCVGASNVDISHNTFEECWTLAQMVSEGMRRSVTSFNINIHGNIFTLSAYPTAPRWSGIIGLDKVDGVTISDNELKITKQSGIALFKTATARNITVKKNTITGVRQQD